MAPAVTLHSLPLFVRLAGRPVILLGDGHAAAAKRRLLDRAGAVIVGEDAQAALAIVAIEDEREAEAAVARLKARGVLINAVDRPALCDFTLPAIVERDPVIVAIGTGGASAGLSAMLRQRLEALLPTDLGAAAMALRDAKTELRAAFPDFDERRRAIARALAPGGPLDLAAPHAPPPTGWVAALRDDAEPAIHSIALRSPDPDELTLREARLLANADRLYHTPDVPTAILDRARADAARIAGLPPESPPPGLSLALSMI